MTSAALAGRDLSGEAVVLRRPAGLRFLAAPPSAAHPLRSKYARRQRYSIEFIWRVARGVCHAMAHLHGHKVRKTPSWRRSWAKSAFSSCILIMMHGPTCIFWANLTSFSHKVAHGQLYAHGVLVDGEVCLDEGGAASSLNTAHSTTY